MADRLHWIPIDTGGREVGSASPGMKPITNFVKRLRTPDLTSKVWLPALRLRHSGGSLNLMVRVSVKSALNAALGGVWHEARANSVFDVGEMHALLWGGGRGS
eukprot:890246-Amphidinium_carterae.2